MQRFSSRVIVRVYRLINSEPLDIASGDSPLNFGKREKILPHSFPTSAVKSALNRNLCRAHRELLSITRCEIIISSTKYTVPNRSDVTIRRINEIAGYPKPRLNCTSGKMPE